ncbi:MAG: hypothetical protein JWQ79_11 [Mucilaginibacter sp.]|nr:hypothetical protein [Mucilaginibacter sp.]
MKKISLTVAILVGCLLFKSADAQLRINLGFNIGSQPDWGPVGYDHAEYYYIPDIDAYYDVPNHQYVYYQNNVWVHAGYLPPRYRNYDLYHGYKVVVNERNPWERHAAFRTRYMGYRGRHDQQIIRESHDNRYRNHWNGDRGHGFGPGNRVERNDQGRGNGPGHDNGHGGGPGHDNGHGDHGGDHGHGGDGGGDHGHDGGGDHGHGHDH